MTISKQAKTALAGWLIGLVLGGAFFGYRQLEAERDLQKAVATCEEETNKVRVELESLGLTPLSCDLLELNRVKLKAFHKSISELAEEDKFDRLLLSYMLVEALAIKLTEHQMDRLMPAAIGASAFGLLFSIPWLWHWFLRRVRELSAAIRGED